MYEDDKFVGWLRYNLFWDNTPFMNMLYLLDNERGKGNGSRLVIFWENEMKKTTNLFLLQLNQTKKHNFFYRKIGYVDSGALLLPNEPLEIILYKKL